MRLYFLLLLLPLSFASIAQQQKIDSLKEVLKSQTVADTIRLKTLNELAYSYYAIDPFKGISVGEEAILLGKKLNTPLILASSYAYKGHNHMLTYPKPLNLVLSQAL